MPNNTDFTLFRSIGKNGINFAVIEGIDHYHTLLDNYGELSSSSLQHYGEQIVPMVDAFVTNEKYSDVDYFDADEDSVFFTLFPNVFISYTETAAHILNIAVPILYTFFLALTVGSARFTGLIGKSCRTHKTAFRLRYKSAPQMLDIASIIWRCTLFSITKATIPFSQKI